MAEHTEHGEYTDYSEFVFPHFAGFVIYLFDFSPKAIIQRPGNCEFNLN